MATEPTQADLELNEVESSENTTDEDDSDQVDTSSIGCVEGCSGTLVDERPQQIGRFAECDQADCDHQEYIKSVEEITAERQSTSDRSEQPLVEVTERL